MMPFAYMGRLFLQEASWRKAENTVVAVGFGIVAFVILVSLMTAVFGGLFDSAALELIILLALFLISRVLYWRSLVKYYMAVDLT